MSIHERKEQLNPVIAHSKEAAETLRGILPAGVSVKIRPEKIKSRNSSSLDIALRDTGDGKVVIEFPKPARVPADSTFIELGSGDSRVQVPVIPGESDDFRTMSKTRPENLNPQLTYGEEQARRMRDAGPAPGRPI